MGLLYIRRPYIVYDKKIQREIFFFVVYSIICMVDGPIDVTNKKKWNVTLKLFRIRNYLDGQFQSNYVLCKYMRLSLRERKRERKSKHKHEHYECYAYLVWTNSQHHSWYNMISSNNIIYRSWFSEMDTYRWKNSTKHTIIRVFNAHFL